MDVYDYFPYVEETPRMTINPPFPPQDPPKKKTFTRRLLVDNRDRISGSPFDFQVVFGNAYRPNSSGVSEYINVSSVEMKLLAFPKIDAEDYVILDVKELNDSNLDASNTAGTRSFAVGYFDTSALSAGVVKPIRDFYSQKIAFDPPLAKLDRLSVKCVKRNGNVVTVGETGNQGNVSMLLEIETFTS